jgi:Mg2+/citrate symporter
MVFRKKVSFLGFLVGGIVDVVSSNIWGIAITVYIVISYKLLSAAPAQITLRVLQIMKIDPWIIAANMFVGGLCSILGGYIGALIAKHDELLNGALSAYLCVLIGLFSIITGAYSTSLIVALLSLLIDPLLCMFGGYLRLLQRSQNKSVLATA